MPLLPASVSVQWREMVIFLEEGIKGLYQIIDRNSKLYRAGYVLEYKRKIFIVHN